jgi:hypothetical protein
MPSTAGTDSSSGRSVSPAVLAVRVLAPLGALALVVAIGMAFAEGAPIGAEGASIATFAWGVVTFVDLGLALVLGWAWIAWREASLPRALLWLVLTTTTGSVALLGYVSGSAWRSSDMVEVLVGPRRRRG